MQVLGLNMEQVNDFLDSCDWIGYERSELATVTGNFVLVMCVSGRHGRSRQRVFCVCKCVMCVSLSLSHTGKLDERITSLHECKFS